MTKPVLSRFIVSEDGRLRAGIRLLLQLVLGLLLMVLAQLLVYGTGNRNLIIAAGGLAMVLSIYISALAFDKRPLSEFGLGLNKEWFIQAGAGVLMAFVVISLLAVIQWGAGWMVFAGYGWNRVSTGMYAVGLGGYVLTMAVVGFYEELWTRGYQVRNLVEGVFTGNNRNLAGASSIAITSLFFGLLHMANPNVTAIGLLTIVLAGVMLALPYLITGELGLSIGLHFAWNAVQGALYGLPVSGISFRQSLLQFQVSGPELWTGGKFGLEGGLLGVIGVLLLTAMSLSWLSYRGYTLRVSPDLTKPPAQV